MADLTIQLFTDANAHWDQSERQFHLSSEYRADSEWARNEDRFKFFLAFYQGLNPALSL